MIALRVSSDLDRLAKGLAKQQASVQRAIAQGLNEGGDKVRTQVRRAMREQTGLIKLQSVTRRERNIRAFAPAGLSYAIVYASKPTKPAEFKLAVATGPGGGVTAWLWGVAHRFKRSFLGKGKIAGRLRMRLGSPRLPTRGFDGPNLAKEAVKGHVAETFLTQAPLLVPPMIEKRLTRAL